MRTAVRLAVAVAALSTACTLDPLSKPCTASTDCIGGYVCVSNHCTPGGGGTSGGGTSGAGTSGGGTSGGGTAGGGTAGGGHAGGGRGGSNGGNLGTTDAGLDAPPPSMCPASVVTACPPTDGGTGCEETFCGGQLWNNGVMKSVLVRFQILDPLSMFSASYRNAIRAAAAAWTRASSGFVTFKECAAACPGHFISVVPGDDDGIANPDSLTEQRLPMPIVGSGGRVSPHRIAHQWGHVVGLAHTYQRADRDRYVRFDPAIWCGPGLPPRCAADPASPPSGFPRVTTDTFGAFDGKSKMNGLPSEGICGGEEPDEDSSEPTMGDISAAAELFFGVTSGWSPFRPIGRSVSPTEPLDYQLAPGVDPVGSPAIAEVESSFAQPEIFVRGTDDRVYTTARSDPSAAEWPNWTWVADHVDADPAAVFAVNGQGTLFLAVRSEDGSIELSSRSPLTGGVLGLPTSLGAPPSGAASAPALASESPFSLAVVVRGGDGLIYWLHYCSDGNAPQACPGATGPSVWTWTALPPPSSGIFVGKPSAVWLLDNGGLNVVAIRDDRVALRMSGVDSLISDWAPAENINADLAPNDPNPGVAITPFSTPGGLAFFARNPQGLLVNDTTDSTFASIGGLLVSPPAAVAVYHASLRTDIAAIIDDHGHPGVWWRFNDAGYTAPCNYNLPGTCAQCGL